VDDLWEDSRDGTLVANPSYSPEHGRFSLGAFIDQGLLKILLLIFVRITYVIVMIIIFMLLAIVWDIFTNTLEAIEVVGMLV
jgi:hypothetical protein